MYYVFSERLKELLHIPFIQLDLYSSIQPKNLSPSHSSMNLIHKKLGMSSLEVENNARND